MTKPTSFLIGDFEAALLHVDTFALDGGAMFGIIPKSLWNRTYACDDQNRITLFGSSLLVRTNMRTILVETGMGSKLSEKEKYHFQVKNEQSFRQVLQPFSLTPGDIDIVILTHLHFDHAGGATEAVDGAVRPVFPNARYIVQHDEFQAACHPNERTRGSYHRHDFLPLKESGNIVVIDGDSEIVPGVRIIKTGGHTAGHQVVLFESNGEGLVHIGDLVPTAAHLPLPYIMGYDTNPLDTLVWRKRLYRTIMDKKMRVIFPHDIHHTIAQPDDLPTNS